VGDRTWKRRPEITAILNNADSGIRESASRVFAASDFVTQSCEQDPQLLRELVAAGDLRRACPAGEFSARAPALTADVPLPEAHVMTKLRHWRRREMLRIAWRDLAGWASLEETLAELSAFADTAINSAYVYARQQLAARYGEPRSVNGEPSRW